MIAMNINYNLEDVSDLNEIEVFLEYDISAEEAARIGAEIARLDNVASVAYVSKEDGIAEMQGEFAEYAYLFSDIGEDENPLSDLYRVIMRIMTESRHWIII